jgi:hypothetical protein
LDGYEILYDGINVMAKWLTQEIIDKCRTEGKTLGVWKLGNKDDTENVDYYRKTWMNCQIDYFFSDQPLRAKECRGTFYLDK